MIRHRHALPLDRRTEAGVLLHAELIAALAQRPLATTREFIRTWLDTVAWVCSRQGPIVFDWFVVGPPSPELLEIAIELRQVRRADARGAFDHEEDRWLDEQGDDAEPWEPPTIPERVVTSLAGRPGIGPLATRLDVQWLIGRRMNIGRDDVLDVIEIGLTLELLVAEVAEVCRIGNLAIADGLEPGERHAWAWAA